MIQTRTTRDILIEDNEVNWDERWVLLDDLKEEIDVAFHMLGFPDSNGENHIKDLDGRHWKDASDIFQALLFGRADERESACKGKPPVSSVPNAKEVWRND